ncbi:MAG: M20 metallopeptidase family protein [Pseudonocardiaceae bacterium]
MDRLIRLRRDIHMHPELARQERRTTSAVSAALAEAGLGGRVSPSGTGFMVDIGAKSGPMIGLRADIDALPIQDNKDVPYRSLVPGVCHACGHDVHTVILVGAAIELARSDLANFGRVRCIFQPAEESPISGSLDMIAAGALDGVDRIFALHCDPSAQVGTVGNRVGPITSAADHMVVKIKGVGGHSGRPHLTPNPIVAVCTVVISLADMVNAQLPERERMLIGFGTISSNGTQNAIPSYAEASGTVRIPDAAVWPRVPDLIKTAVRNIVGRFALDCDVDYVRVCPAVVNDSNATEVIDRAALSIVGRGNVYEPPQSFGGEDFSWYLKDVPGAIFRLGVGAPGSMTQVDLHSGHFDVDERAIAVGVKMFTRIAIDAARAIGGMGKAVHGSSG